jgi:hypothetical protein
LKTPNDNGLPVGDEADALESFEEQLVARVAGSGVLVLVITTSGMREFVLYTGDAGWLPQLHEDLQAALPDYDVQMVGETDPKWAVYKQFR